MNSQYTILLLTILFFGININLNAQERENINGARFEIPNSPTLSELEIKYRRINSFKDSLSSYTVDKCNFNSKIQNLSGFNCSSYLESYMKRYHDFQGYFNDRYYFEFQLEELVNLDGKLVTGYIPSTEVANFDQLMDTLNHYLSTDDFLYCGEWCTKIKRGFNEQPFLKSENILVCYYFGTENSEIPRYCKPIVQFFEEGQTWLNVGIFYTEINDFLKRQLYELQRLNISKEWEWNQHRRVMGDRVYAEMPEKNIFSTIERAGEYYSNYLESASSFSFTNISSPGMGFIMDEIKCNDLELDELVAELRNILIENPLKLGTKLLGKQYIQAWASSRRSEIIKDWNELLQLDLFVYNVYINNRNDNSVHFEINVSLYIWINYYNTEQNVDWHLPSRIQREKYLETISDIIESQLTENCTVK